MCFFPVETYKVSPLKISERALFYHKSGKNKLIFPTSNLYMYAKGHRCSEQVILPCGKCEKCLTLRAKNWSIRAMHEARYYSENSFITLTYDDTQLPFNNTKDDKNISQITHRGGKNDYNTPATLYKRDFQLFMKRLRKYIYQTEGKKIKYLMCGEYGEQRHRPHYHAIIFGYQFKDLELTSNNAGCEHNLYNSLQLNKLWSHGIVKVGEVSVKSVQYVCRYTMKKIYGDEAIEEYNDTKRIPPYLAVSHGIGKQFYIQYEDQILQNDYILHPEKMTKCQLPRYYDKLIVKYHGEEKLNEIKQKRIDKAAKKYNPIEDTQRRRNEAREVYLSKLKLLRRNYEANTNTS